MVSARLAELALVAFVANVVGIEAEPVRYSSRRYTTDDGLPTTPDGYGWCGIVRRCAPGVIPDCDGMTNTTEARAGSDPHDPNSGLKGYSDLCSGLVGGEFAGIVVEWQSGPEKRYVVERTAKSGTPFVTVGPAVNAATARSGFANSQATSSGPFSYRIRIK